VTKNTGDATLKAFISTNFTMPHKLNFNGGANTTINGVSGFQIVTSGGSTSGVNWIYSVGAFDNYTGSGGGFYLTDPESVKMGGFAFNFRGSFELRLLGLTPGKTYQTSFWSSAFDTTLRALDIRDQDSAAVIVTTSLFHQAIANSPTNIWSFTYVASGYIATQKQFTLTGEFAHINAITTIQLD
jgi:hypothetical protein